MVGRVKGECGGEEKENDEGTTSIAWTRFGKPAKKGRVEKEEEEEEEETVVMEGAEERKGYRLISSSHVRTTPSGGSGGQRVSKRVSKRASERASELLTQCARTRIDDPKIHAWRHAILHACWGVLYSGRRWLTDHH